MLNSGGKLVKESYFIADTTITYEYISPAKYTFKIISDDNGNKNGTVDITLLSYSQRKFISIRRRLKYGLTGKLKRNGLLNSNMLPG